MYVTQASSSGTVTAVQSPSVDFTPKSCDGVTPYVGEKPKVELLNSGLVFFHGSRDLINNEWQI